MSASLRSAGGQDGMPRYLEEHFQRRNNEDYIGLAVAENALMYDLLAPKMSSTAVTPGDLKYGDFQGHEELRKAIALLMERCVFRRPLDPSHVIVLNGCGSCVSELFYAICDENQGVSMHFLLDSLNFRFLFQLLTMLDSIWISRSLESELFQFQ